MSAQPPHATPADPPTAARDRRQLLDEFVARDAPPCPGCRRPLPAVPERRCPHCHTELQLGIDPRGSGSMAWAAGVLVAALGSGFHLLTLPFLILEFLGRGTFGLSGPFPIAWAAGFPVTVGLLATWLFARRRIRRWSRAGIVVATIATGAIAIASIASIAILA